MKDTDYTNEKYFRKMITNRFKKDLECLIERCVKALDSEGLTGGVFTGKRLLDVELEVPKDKAHGDLAANIALRLANQAGKKPMEYALLLADRINQELGRSPLKDKLNKAEARAPGFINFRFTESRVFKTLGHIRSEKNNYGRSSMGKKAKLNIEFVSANPTGPLTIAHGRQAVFGDSLANILEFAGYRVTREYYLNDEGNQIKLLAKSIRARYLELFGKPADFPEDGYKGAYVIDIAGSIKSKYGSRFLRKEHMGFFADYGCKWMVNDIKKDLESFNVKFDVWCSQKSLNSSGRIKMALRILRKRKLIYEKEGAVWFKSTYFGDDKDRVIVKSSGDYTYLLPDIAYHMHKFKRRFSNLIDIWGPDHHGYILRIKAAVKALGNTDTLLRVLIVQLCTLYKGGKVVQMSTRAGEFITLHSLVKEVGKDAARFFFLRRNRNSHLDFDLELAKKHSMDNPVYYIQYAHARICSILKYRKREKGHGGKNSFDRKHLKETDELTIIKLLANFPYVIESCTKKLEVFPLLSYLEETASSFHSYYNKYRIVTDEHNVTKARLFLCLAIRTVLANGLKLLGVASPQSM
ncbi:MAG: arginine--tRNA ligase [Candidatus Omnitrophota bacterium]|nr:arginine--tRNA ligase [Candidatus Omnitrophota bacterium]